MDVPCLDNGAHQSYAHGFHDKGAHDSDFENERDVDDVSETELSKIELYDGIKRMVEHSVEIIKKERTERKKKRKRFDGNVGDAFYNEEESKAYSRCSLPYLYKVNQSITCSERKISLVRKMGFEHTLQIDDCYIPRLFAQWIADRTRPDEQLIKLDEKSIPINPKSFEDVLGIPAGHLPVETDEESGKAAFLECFGLSEVPSIKFFGDKIINNNDLGDDEFCMCYGAVVLSTFICPNSSQKPSTKYMGALVDTDNIKNRNWCQFAHDWLMLYIKKYLKERAKHNKSITLGGCIYQQAVRYLDFIDLGPVKLPSTLPRIRVWKGDLIKHFSDMDKRKDGSYGSHTVKHESQTCYARPINTSKQQETNQHTFKSEIDTVAGEFMSNEVKDEIYNAFLSHMIDTDPELYKRTQALVINLLKIIVQEGVSNSSETTLVVTQDSIKEGDEAHQQKKQKADVKNPGDNLSRNNVEFNTTSQAKAEEALKTNDVHIGQAKTVEAKMKRVRSFSLNHTVPLDDGSSSSSFSNTQLEPPVRKNEVNNITNNQVEKQACFIKTIPTIVQEYINADSKSENDISREEYLKEASKKYYFKDPSIPSMRLFDYLDDNGTYVEEPELRRPLFDEILESEKHNIQELEEQLEQNNFDDVPKNNNNNYELMVTKFRVNNLNEEPEIVNSSVDGYFSPPRQANPSFVYSSPKQKTPTYTSKANTDFEFSSIQCAQRQPPYSRALLPENEMVHSKETKDFIDLDPSTDPSQPSPLTPTDQGDTKSIIRGRRLFHDITEDGDGDTKSSGQKLNLSPEVQYLGERSFNTVCNNMATKSNELYNAGLTLGNASQSFGKENLPPKRVINRSNWLKSPYECNQRPIIEPKDIKLHEIITTICEDEQYCFNWVINIDNCKVSLIQLGKSMRPDGWVEAWVVNAFCRKLFKDNHPRKSNKHWFFHTSSEYFLEKWPNDFMKEKWKKNVIRGFHGADSARRLHLSHRLHFPSLYQGHWFVFLVDLVAHKFMFLDSYYEQGSDYHNRIDNLMIENFKRTWNECNLRDMGFNSYEIFFPNVPKQKNKNDCGIFTMKFMEFYCPRNPKSCSFSANDVPGFRVRIAVDTMFNEYNTEIDNMFLISSFDLKEYKSQQI